MAAHSDTDSFCKICRTISLGWICYIWRMEIYEKGTVKLVWIEISADEDGNRDGHGYVQLAYSGDGTTSDGQSLSRLDAVCSLLWNVSNLLHLTIVALWQMPIHGGGLWSIIGVRANIHLGGQPSFARMVTNKCFVFCPNKCHICPNWGVNCPPPPASPSRTPMWSMPNHGGLWPLTNAQAFMLAVSLRRR